ESAQQRQQRTDKQTPARQPCGLLVQPHRQIGEALDKIPPKAEQLQLLGAFLASAQNSQVLHFAARGRLRKAQRVAEKREMRFANESWHQAKAKREENPRREKENAGAHADRGHSLLPQPARRLDHQYAVSSLHARAL